MTEQELVDLEIECQALLITAAEMGKNDRIMDVKIMEMIQQLHTRAAQIRKIIQESVSEAK